MLLLDGNGIGEEIGNKQAVEDYLSTHIDTWFDWATKKMGYSLKRSDLMFVWGTVKTKKWACAAFSGGHCNKMGSLNVNAAGGGALNIKVSIEKKPSLASFKTMTHSSQ